jgi:hypothetical protein
MDRKATKMLVRDVSVVVAFVIFVWVTMCFIMSSILSAVGYSHTRSTIIIIGVTALLCATLSLVVLILHLKKNRRDVYADEMSLSETSVRVVPDETLAEEMPPDVGSRKLSHGALVKAFDIVFIMVLCFATLLAAMLIRGKTVNGAAIYSFGIASLLATVIGFTVYFVVVLKSSDKELRMMVAEMYSEEAETDHVSGKGALE